MKLAVAGYVRGMVDLGLRLRGAAGRRLSAPPVGRAAAALVAAIIVAAAASAALSPAGARAAGLSALGLAAGGGVMLAALARSYPHGRLGLGNLVTLVRAAIVAVLAGLLIAPGTLAQAPAAPNWAALALAGMVLALDGADGWAARRAGLESRFGARFDMEVDVALALVLALLAWQSDKAGVWVLGLGLMRHAFVLAGLLWPALRAPLPDARLRKGVCVVQIGVLTALLAPPVTPPLSQWVAAGALALLCLSFARDVAWLMRGGARR